MANVAKDFAQLISESKDKKTGPYDTQAVVKRIEGNTVWVSIPGGIDETPIEKTINCTAGDKVQVRVSGGRAWITGNATAPPTDDTTAIKADTTANKAQVIAVDAKETAEAVEGIAVSASATATTAKTIAEGVNEHFWHDSTGAHVTEVTQEEWNDISDPNYHSGGNTLITTQGMAIRNGLDNLAQFGSTGAVIGEVTNGNSRTEISTSGMQIYQKVSGNDVSIANLGYGPGKDSGGTTSDAPYYSLGVRTGTVGNYSTAEGHNTEASGYTAHAEGDRSTASAAGAHAEGLESTASGVISHVEGYQSTASGDYSHAEGQITEASNECAHAEGLGTVASGMESHAQNMWTIADQYCQTAVGKFNTANNTNNLFVVGNGTTKLARADAFQVDTSGNTVASGTITDGFGNVLSNKIESSYLAIQSTTIYSNQSVSGSSYVSASSHSLTKPDNTHSWKAIAIAGWSLTQHNIRFSSCYIDGTASVYAGLHNDSTSTLSVTATLYVLWVRTA